MAGTGRPTRLILEPQDHKGRPALKQREAVGAWEAPDSAWGGMGGLPGGGGISNNGRNWPEWAVGGGGVHSCACVHMCV